MFFGKKTYVICDTVLLMFFFWDMLSSPVIVVYFTMQIANSRSETVVTCSV